VSSASRKTIPTGWRIVRLGDVAEQCLGKMLDAQKNKGRPLPYLRNPNVRWFEVDTSDLQQMPFEDHEFERYGLREGDVVVCEGGEAGRAAIWDGRLPDLKFQKAIHRVRPGPDLFNRFLVYRLMADYHSGRLADYYTGATIKHLTGQDLSRYEIPLPPLAEQRRIAEVLDRAEALRAKRRAALAQLDTLAQALFLDLFGDPVTNPKAWKRVGMPDAVVGKYGIKAGPFGSSLKKEDYTTSGYRVYGQEQVIAGRFDIGDYYIGERKYQQLKACTVNKGDLLISLVGSFGKVLVVPPEIEPGIINPRLLKITPNHDLLTSSFLAALLALPAIQAEFERVAHGGTMGILTEVY
jgi:type I restriction enzyme S subunit